jgi:hypothetical protein
MLGQFDFGSREDCSKHHEWTITAGLTHEGHAEAAVVSEFALLSPSLWISVNHEPNRPYVRNNGGGGRLWHGQTGTHTDK